ncbi:hypothetical protein TNCV_101901 [Trichonephila clavipes]|nr:hypothetical protein TNCV_101901 [Trichonephila clavipes]
MHVKSVEFQSFLVGVEVRRGEKFKYLARRIRYIPRFKIMRQLDASSDMDLAIQPWLKACWLCKELHIGQN